MMLSAPHTVTFYNPITANAGTWEYYNSTTKIADYAPTASPITERGFSPYRASLTAATVTNGAWSASAEL
jgi:hypothetical protein